MNTDLMFSSLTVEWATPQALFDELNAEFGFTLDACATLENAKVKQYLPTEGLWDALAMPWDGVVWCNPPYGRGIGAWIEKGADSASKGATVVMLLPARTDTKWFHEIILPNAEIRFIKGRLKFGDAVNNAPFPSMVVVFK